MIKINSKYTIKTFVTIERTFGMLCVKVPTHSSGSGGGGGYNEARQQFYQVQYGITNSWLVSS